MDLNIWSWWICGVYDFTEVFPAVCVGRKSEPRMKGTIDNEGSLPEHVHLTDAEHESACHGRCSQVDRVLQVSRNRGLLCIVVMGSFGDGKHTECITECTGVLQRPIIVK